MRYSTVFGFLVLLPSLNCIGAGDAIERAQDAHARLGDVCESVLRAEAEAAALPEGFPGGEHLETASEFCRQVAP